MIDIFLIILLIAVAIALFLLEAIFLPGITLAAIGSGICSLGALVLAFTISETTGWITLVGLLISYAIALAWMLRTKSLNKIALDAEVDSTIASVKDLGIKIGEEGITLSRLAPTGKVLVNGKTVEATCPTGMIDEQRSITVIGIEGYQLTVEEKSNENFENK